MKLHPNIKYRSDIDGLRALAVLSVILFHINGKWIPGGFLGVDIFFVISGYLITLILTKEIDSTKRIDILNFYKRRIKRIIPALLFMLIPTFILGVLFLTPNDILSLSKSVVWSLFSAANIYFFSSVDTGYFARASNELPLLHLWSLGVEEQFYILWPFIVLFLLKYITDIKKRLIISSLIFIVSLIWAHVIIVTNQPFAYYMLPTRAWELLGGAIVALLVHNGFKMKNIYNEIIAFLGLILIILSFIFVSESYHVPGIPALPVIVGSSFLILSGISYRTYIGKFLSLKIFVSIGLVSYSAYLWHWPILAFLHYAYIEIDLFYSILVIICTFILATISYYFIESPLRKNDISTKKVFLYYFLLPSIIIVSTSFFIQNAIANKLKFVYPFSQIEKLNNNTYAANHYKYNCQLGRNFDTSIYDSEKCLYPMDSHKADILLIGDSHAAHYLGLLQSISSFSIRNVSVSCCAVLLNSSENYLGCMGSAFRKSCETYNNTIVDEIQKYNTIIIGQYWSTYFYRKGFKDSLSESIDFLSKNNKKVILLAQIQSFPDYSQECKKREIHLKNINCEYRFNHAHKQIEANNYIQDLAKNYSNVEYLNIDNYICDKGICSPYFENKPIYYDSNHMSLQGSKRIGEQMIINNDVILNLFKDIGKKDN